MKKYLGLKIVSFLFFSAATVYAGIMLGNMLTAGDAEAVLGAVLGGILSIVTIAPLYLVGMILAIIGLILCKKSGAPKGIFISEIILPIVLMATYVLILMFK